MNIQVPKIEYANISEQIVIILRSYILRGLIKPNERLNLDFLAKQFGCSTTPVRDAMHMLSAQGLVDIVPRKGTVVRGISDEVRHENYEMNEILYGAATYFACLRYDDPDEIISLRDREEFFFHNKSESVSRELSQTTIDLYNFIERNCKNSQLVEALHRYSINEIMAATLESVDYKGSAEAEQGASETVNGLLSVSKIHNTSEEHAADKANATHTYHMNLYKYFLERDAANARNVMIEYLKYKNRFFEENMFREQGKA